MSQLFERLIESIFIVFSFSFSKADQTITIPTKQQHTSVIDTIQRSNISDTIWCYENQSKVIWIENFVRLSFKVALRTRTREFSCFSKRILVHILISQLVRGIISIFTLFFFRKFKVVFQVFSSSELLQHNHFIFSILRRLCQQLFFLHFLSHVNNLWPVLFVLCLEVFQKFVETGVTFCHAFDTFVQTFSRLLLLCLYKRLKFFNFRNSFGSTCNYLITGLLFVTEKQHLGFLITILVSIGEYLWRYGCNFLSEPHPLKT